MNNYIAIKKLHQPVQLNTHIKSLPTKCIHYIYTQIVYIGLFCMICFSTTSARADWFSSDIDDFMALAGTEWFFQIEDDTLQIDFSEDYYEHDNMVFLQSSDSSDEKGIVLFTDKLSEKKGDNYFVLDHGPIQFAFKPFGHFFSGKLFIEKNDIYYGPFDFTAKEHHQISTNSIFVPDNYQTINEAIKNCSPGGTIVIKSGTYSESISITKSISIIGEQGALIDGNYEKIPVSIESDNVSLINFEITGGDQYGLKFLSAKNCVLSNMIVSSTKCSEDRSIMDAHALYINNSDNIRIKKSTIHNTFGANSNDTPGDAYGLKIENSTNIQILSCHIFDQLGGGSQGGDGGDGIGVKIINSENVHIIQSSIHNNKGRINGGGFGLAILNSLDIYIKSSEIIMNEGGSSILSGSGGGFGVYIDNSSIWVCNSVISQNAGGTGSLESYGIYISKNSIDNSRKVTIGGAHQWFNVFYSSKYHIYNDSQNSILAAYNDWGTSSPSDYIYDCEDSSNKGCVMNPGDMDNNGLLDLRDLIVVLQVLTTKDISHPPIIKIDVNNDLKCGFQEVLFIMNQVSGL